MLLFCHGFVLHDAIQKYVFLRVFKSFCSHFWTHVGAILEQIFDKTYVKTCMCLMFATFVPVVLFYVILLKNTCFYVFFCHFGAILEASFSHFGAVGNILEACMAHFLPICLPHHFSIASRSNFFRFSALKWLSNRSKIVLKSLQETMELSIGFRFYVLFVFSTVFIEHLITTTYKNRDF